MLPTLVIVGRPNVGKSTLFNRLTRSRDAIVHDLPGLTRDRHYGKGRVGERQFTVVDTGGFEPIAKDGIFAAMAEQTLGAIAEADCVLFVVDGRQGLTPQDRRIADLLRRGRAPIHLVVNKAEGMNAAVATAEFHELGLGEPVAISAAHGEGIRELAEHALAIFPSTEPAAAADEDAPSVPRIAIVGRPNVGKSTLVNRLVGEERMIAFDEPGTTRDAIFVDLHRHGRDYVLIDTAGIRRRGKVFEAVEKFSVIKTMQAIDAANVVVLVLDARAEISDQDAHIAGYILEAGRALVVAINKWDNLAADRREDIKRELGRRLHFLDFADQHFISAKDGSGLTPLFASVDLAYASAMSRLSTPKLNTTLRAAVARHQAPLAGFFRPKLRYAHQGGHNPPVVVIHGTNLDALADPYRRYLEKSFREAFNLRGTPLRIDWKAGENPFAGRRNVLTPRQLDAKRRFRKINKRRFG
jgi:GTP-binding protein